MLRIPFNDGWKFGVKQNEFAEAGGASSKIPVRLPHDAMITAERDETAAGGAPNAYFPGGVWEYTKDFDAPEEWATKVVSLVFEGVYRSAVVSLNGARIAIQHNGYSEFVVGMDTHLKFGERNVLTVEVRAHGDSRWYTGAGIYRPVHLIVAEPVHIAFDGVTVRAPEVDDAEALIEVETVLVNTTRRLVTACLETKVIDGRGNVVLADETPVSIIPGEDATASQRMLLGNPDLWSPDGPNLYEVRTTLRLGDLTLDRSIETFGIRRLQVDTRHGLRINGTPVLLRGACVHHDNGILGAATIGRAEERRVQLLKEAGFNALRSSHQPMSRAMLEACDRVGMLVIDEVFDSWTRAKSDFDYSLDFENGWRADVAAMVAKDRNHACVIAYSIGNEIPELATPNGAAWSRRISTYLRRLDRTRFVTAAVNGALTVMAEVIAAYAEQSPSGPQAAEGMGINTFLTQMAEHNNAIGSSELVTTRTAEAFATLDIAGMNYLDGRYKQDALQFPHRVIVGSETFPTRIAGLWHLVETLPHVIGDFTWTGWDYLGEVGIGRTILASEPISGLLAPYPWLTAWTGDLDITGFRRPASYYREIVFGRRSSPYIAVQNPATYGEATISGPWAWSDSTESWTWPHHGGRLVRVEVYSDADEVELLLNHRSLGRRAAGPACDFRAEFDVSYEPGTLIAVAYRNGTLSERTELATTGDAVRLAIEVDRPRIANTDEDLAFVTLSVVDVDDRLTSYDARITIELDGPAELVGFGSAEPATEEPFSGDTHTTFRGRALAAIRPRGIGAVTVVATAEGVETGSVTFEIKQAEAEEGASSFELAAPA